MQAYEFDTVVRDGIIRIPSQYIGRQLSSVRVIIIDSANKPDIQPQKQRFSAMRLKTKGFKFNRDEANER